jgi:meso-butanediol dehydrogenase / (S,S)-butanediol dehydrogenase / diacetyl reductase
MGSGRINWLAVCGFEWPWSVGSTRCAYLSTVMRFVNKIALITGAGSGIGRAVTIRIVEEGGSVFAVDVNEAGLKETADLVGDKVRTEVADIGDPDACVAVVANCVHAFGRLDVLGNVAGIYRAAHTTDMTREDYRRVMSVNLDGPFYLSQAAIPHLLKTGGNIVNIASNSGIQGVPYSAAYSASKGGIVQLTRSLAVEFLKTALRVNAIAPAGTNTNIAASANFPADMDPDLRGRMAGLRGLAEPAEVAGLFAYLASDEARSVTGAVYTIDNGITVS